jgi:hypothetical protein
LDTFFALTYQFVSTFIILSLSQSKPEGEFAFQQLKDNYYPGDVGFDPLSLKPTDADEFATMQTKELQNGRLAMLGAAGMIAQELVK